MNVAFICFVNYIQYLTALSHPQESENACSYDYLFIYPVLIHTSNTGLSAIKSHLDVTAEMN